MVWKTARTGSYEVLVFLTCLWKGELYEAHVRELEIWGKHASPSGGFRAAIRFPTSSLLLPSCRSQCYVVSAQKAG